MREYRFSFEAEEDLNQIIAWYSDISENLGFQVALALQVAVEFICEHPYAAQSVGNTLRRKLINQYSLVIYYSVDDQFVYIQHIRDQRSDHANDIRA